MPDRLDDAIDAVVRAVDRIERATRDAGVEAQQLQARADEPTAETVASTPVADETAVAAPPAAAAGATPAGSAPPEVYELVGRIVGRTQALEQHLDAARALRAEISALVAQLAAAASDRP